LEQAFIVSKASWKGTANSDMAGSPARRAFYTDLTAQMAEAGLVQIWVLELEGCPIAVQYQLVSDRGVHLLVSDFAENRRELSPGTVLLYHAIERLHEGGGKEFDFCGDAYDYKMAWATGVRRHVSIQVFNSKPYSRFIYVTKSRILPLLRRIGGGKETGGNVQPVSDQE
jgi:CelD/BcsL family acetyltransferase involved in cellulose biosynthesis